MKIKRSLPQILLFLAILFSTPYFFQSTFAASNLPLAPASITVSASTDKVNLIWSKSSDVSGIKWYEVERCIGVGCADYKFYINVRGTIFSNTVVTPSTSYAYRVRAISNKGIASPYSSIVRATTLPTTLTSSAPLTPASGVPLAPASVTASASTDQVNLAWSKSYDSSGIKWYELERCAGVGCTNYAYYITVRGNTFSNTVVNPSTTYAYRLRAISNTGIASAYSGVVRASTILNSSPSTSSESAPQTPQPSVASFSFHYTPSTTYSALTVPSFNSPAPSPSPSLPFVPSIPPLTQAQTPTPAPTSNPAPTSTAAPTPTPTVTPTSALPTPTPTPTVLPVTVASISVSGGSITQQSLLPGQMQTIRATLNGTGAFQNLIVQLRIRDSSLNIVANKITEGFTLPANTSTPVQFDYQPTNSLPPGTYTADIGVWSADYAKTYVYEQIATFTVPSGSLSTSLPPTPPPTQTSSPSLSTGITDVAPFMWAWDNVSLLQSKQLANMNSVILAFAITNGTCALDPDIYSKLADARNYVAAGGKLTLSFGGQIGTYAEVACTDDQLFSLLEKTITDFGTRRLDFDVEGLQLQNTDATARRSRVLARLQAKYPDLYISMTLPGWFNGLTSDGVNLLQSLVAAGVRVDMVNVMAMSFGPEINVQAGSSMSRGVILTYESAIKQMQAIWPNKTLTQLHQMSGVTPMIGVNDDFTIFTLADAQTIASYAQTNTMGLIAYWAFQRDHAQTTAGMSFNTNSGVAQSDYQFLNTFKGR